MSVLDQNTASNSNQQEYNEIVSNNVDHVGTFSVLFLFLKTIIDFISGFGSTTPE